MNTEVTSLPDAVSPAPPQRTSWLRPIWRFIKRLPLRFLRLLVVLLAILILVVAIFWSRIVHTILPGEAGVLYQRLLGGTVTDYVYNEGIHLTFPWDHMYIYDTRVNIIHHSFDVLTNRGLPIHLDLAIRYQPEYEMVGVLHQRVGPDYLDKIVIPQSESVLRREIGQHNPEDIYTNKAGILSAIISNALEEMSQKYVIVDDIIIRKMTLPPTVKSAIEQKLVYEQQEQAYDFLLIKERREAERKEIEAAGIREYQRIITETLDQPLLTWQGINATLSLAESNNAKVVIIGSGDKGLPIILGSDYTRDSGNPPATDAAQTATSAINDVTMDAPSLIQPPDVPTATQAPQPPAMLPTAPAANLMKR